MGKWFKEFQDILWFTGLAVGAVIWAISTFPTAEAVNSKAEKAYVDQISKDQEKGLERIERRLELLDARTLDMYRILSRRP